MRKLLKLMTIPFVSATASPTLAQTAYPAINEAARIVSQELRVYASCHLGKTPEVGIWPLKGDALPIADASAVAFYETVFAALNATKPDCVTFVDGAGASGVIRYFIQVGDGAEARRRIDEAFRGATYTVSLDVFDRGGRVQADLKIADAAGATIAAPPAFDVPDDFVGTSCAAGAVPLNRAVRTAARSLIERAPELSGLVDQAGRFADTDEAPSFTSYFGRLMIDALTAQASDVLAGRSVRLAGEDALGEPGTYAFSFRYWPCGDGTATEISAQLRALDGTTATWRGMVRLDRVPGWIEVFPAEPETEVESEPQPVSGSETDAEPGSEPEARPEPEQRPEPEPRPEPVAKPFFSLSFAPRTTTVGDVVSIVADIAPGCEPMFLDMTEAGDVQIVPNDVFETEPRPDGGLNYRVDTSTPMGLRITEADDKGVHFVGYICTQDGVQPNNALLREILSGLSEGVLRRTDPDAGPVFWFERYVIR